MRRNWLRTALVGALGLTACTGTGQPAVPSGPTAADSRPAPTAATPPSTAPSTAPGTAPSKEPSKEPVLSYRPEPGEVRPQLKVTAARFLEELATYEPNRFPALATQLAEQAREVARPLFVSDVSSRIRIRFIQLGGLRPIAAPVYGSAMIVADQIFTDASGRSSSLLRTADVRVRVRDGAWVVDELSDAGGVPRPPQADLHPAAVDALADPGLSLPDSSRWDIEQDEISPTLLRALVSLARATPLVVAVLKTGHPLRVIDNRASPPFSAHTRGRAADIWAVDGIPVSRMTEKQVRDFGREVLALPGVTQVGVPTGMDLDGGGRRSFANAVHDDHIHIAVRR